MSIVLQLMGPKKSTYKVYYTVSAVICFERDFMIAID